MEVGLAAGGSALTILATLKECAESGFNHSAIDPFQNANWYGSALKLIEDEGFGPNFTFYEGLSSLVLPELITRNKRHDLIYVDGSHSFENVVIDYYVSVSLINGGDCLV